MLVRAGGRQAFVPSPQPLSFISNIPHSTYHLPVANYLSFQQHYRFMSVTTFVFYNIPALSSSVELRPFVFIDIPALLVHFLKLLVFSFPVGSDILS
jgi:hypothetical protein